MTCHIYTGGSGGLIGQSVVIGSCRERGGRKQAPPAHPPDPWRNDQTVPFGGCLDWKRVLVRAAVVPGTSGTGRHHDSLPSTEEAGAHDDDEDDCLSARMPNESAAAAAGAWNSARLLFQLWFQGLCSVPRWNPPPAIHHRESQLQSVHTLCSTLAQGTREECGVTY